MYRPLVMRSGASLVSVPPGSNDDNPLDVTEDRITIQDWSRTGRGSHVDFEKQEKVPLDQGSCVVTRA